MKQPKKLLMMYFISIIIGVIVDIAVNYTIFIKGILYSIAITTFCWFTFILIFKLFLKNINWQKVSIFRILAIIFSYAVFNTALIIFYLKIMYFGSSDYYSDVVTCVYTAVFSMIIGLMVIGQEALINLKKSIEENAQMKQEMIQSQYETLKNQVNPHFLFNSLNTLATIIPTQPAVAVDFVEQMSKVFRYSLQHSNQNTIELGTELKVVKSYLFLNEQRYDGKLQVSINLPDAVLEKKIITQSLLMLVENAIKHNEISHEHPLSINIYADGDFLVISNTLQRKSILEPSTNTGLENIKKRYSLTNSLPVSVQEKDGLFIVQLPLLNE